MSNKWAVFEPHVHPCKPNTNKLRFMNYESVVLAFDIDSRSANWYSFCYSHLSYCLISQV